MVESSSNSVLFSAWQKMCVHNTCGSNLLSLSQISNYFHCGSLKFYCKLLKGLILVCVPSRRVLHPILLYLEHSSIRDDN